jgi:hypothetical protein
MAERKPLTWLKASICLVESLAAKPEVTVSLVQRSRVNVIS